MDVKMFQMGFGESIMVSNEQDCLLIDCGSESTFKSRYFNNVEHELKKYGTKSAMLTHFHNDHLNGFVEIIKTNPNIFQNVYIPYVFTMSHPNYVDFDIIRVLLEEKVCPASRSISMWELLECLVKNEKHICLLKRNDTFSCVNENFQVLWPIPEKLVPTRIFTRVKEMLSEDAIRQVEALSDIISESFLDFQLSEEPSDAVFEKLHGIVGRVEELKSFFTNVNKKAAKSLWDSLNQNANKASIVFHNIGKNSNQTYLFTADIPSTIMGKIAENKYDYDLPLMKEYYAIKAPHHGTNTHYFHFGCYTSFKNIFISNGDTPNVSKRGLISEKYNDFDRKYYIICTNNFPDRCESACSACTVKCSKPTDKCGCSSSFWKI